LIRRTGTSDHPAKSRVRNALTFNEQTEEPLSVRCECAGVTATCWCLSFPPGAQADTTLYLLQLTSFPTACEMSAPQDRSIRARRSHDRKWD
jgi:hypothetical protein